MNEMSASEKALAEVRQKGQEGIVEEKNKIEALIKVAKDEKLSLDDRQKAVNALNKIIPNYNAQLDATTGKYMENKKALDDYQNSLAKKYELEGAKDLLKEIGKEKAKLAMELKEADDAIEKDKQIKASSNFVGGREGRAMDTGAATYTAHLKKQQQASEAQGYAQGGFTPQGRVNEEVGVVHAGEWVASQKLLASPVARPLINALDYAQRTNTIGSLRADDVSRTIVGTGAVASPSPQPVIIQAPTDNVASAALAQSAAVLSKYEETMNRLSQRLNEPFVTVNTVTGDTGIKQAQEEYDTLIRNKSPKSRRK